VFVFNSQLIADDSGFNTELSFAQDEMVELHDDWYIIPNVGMISIVDFRGIFLGDSIGVEFDRGTTYGFSIGKRTSDSFRWQFEYSNSKNEIDTVNVNGTDFAVNALANALGADSGSAEFEQTALMLSAIWDWDPAPCRYFDNKSDTLRPYIGLGIGQVATDLTVDFTLDGTSYSISDWEWDSAYQAIAGFRVDLSPTSDLQIGYRYLNVDTDYGNVISHTINVGFGIKF
jgi:opacity protein-like surface antigen